MRNRDGDILYCGCDINKIKRAKPRINDKNLAEYVFYNKERTKIYYKKEVLKESYPWTDSKTLKEYKFTNTKRFLDRTSKDLIKKVLDLDICIETKLFNIMILRSLFLNSDFLQSGYIDFEKLDSTNDKFDEKYLKEYYLKDLRNFLKVESKPYFNSGVKLSIQNFLKTKDYLFGFLEMFKTFLKDIKNNYLFSNSPKQITETPFFFGSRFLSYQYFVDLTYCKDYKFSENEFVISGPGCSKGINFLFEDLDCLNDEEAIFWLRDNIQNICDFNPKEIFHFLPEEDQIWSVMDIENSFCEFSKYMRLIGDSKTNVRKYKIIESTSFNDF